MEEDRMSQTVTDENTYGPSRGPGAMVLPDDELARLLGAHRMGALAINKRNGPREGLPGEAARRVAARRASPTPMLTVCWRTATAGYSAVTCSIKCVPLRCLPRTLRISSE
jgi:hypothetical protein